VPFNLHVLLVKSANYNRQKNIILHISRKSSCYLTVICNFYFLFINAAFVGGVRIRNCGFVQNTNIKFAIIGVEFVHVLCEMQKK
jgi:hypothetical protein